MRVDVALSKNSVMTVCSRDYATSGLNPARPGR
jgi:hypothetical protein